MFQLIEVDPKTWIKKASKSSLKSDPNQNVASAYSGSRLRSLVYPAPLNDGKIRGWIASMIQKGSLSSVKGLYRGKFVLACESLTKQFILLLFR